MNFLRNKYAQKILLLCILFGGWLPHIFCQVVLSPKSDDNAPIILNDYYKTISVVPAEPILSEYWYSKPKEIAQRFDLYGINPDTRYFEDDVPYLEKTIDGIKGRLFLKEINGYRYQIFDLQFVPYFDLEAEEKSASEEERNLNVELNLEEQNLDDITSNKSADAKQDTVQNSVAQSQLVNPVANLNSRETVDKESPSNEDEKEIDEGKNSVIPLYKNRDDGYSIIIDVGLKKTGADVKRDILYRFDGNTNKLYEESYVYTNRGAIQRLTRLYANGAIQRFVYYFSTGGLKEIFYQDPDGSTYLLAYTLAGALSTKQLYDINNKLIYDLSNTYSESDKLVRKIEIDNKEYQVTETEYKNGQIITRRIYSFKTETPDKVADGNETPDKVADNNETPDKVADGNETLDKVADGNETLDKVADGNETLDKVADNNETLDKVADNNETLDKVADSNETLDKVTDGNETLDKVADGNETLDKVTDGNETLDKVADGNETLDKVADGNETLDKVADGNETLDKVADGNETLDKVADSNEDSATIATEQVTEEEVDSQQIFHTSITFTEHRDSMTLLRTDNYEYNPSGNQIASKSVNLMHEDVSSVSYKDEVKTEAFFRNNVLIKEVVTDKDERLEIYYFQQEPVYKLYYKRNKKLKEEVLVEGKIVETRIIE